MSILFVSSRSLRSRRQSPDDGRSPADYDLVIFDRVQVPALTQGNFILIDTIAPNLPIAVNGRVKGPRVIGTDGKHPIAEGVNLADLRISEALRAVPERTARWWQNRLKLRSC